MALSLARSFSNLTLKTIKPGITTNLTNLSPSLASFQNIQTRQYVGKYGIKVRFSIKKERPVGPNKVLPPYVRDAHRRGEPANYRRLIHYPEHGNYTIKKLKIWKLGGRNPATGRKVIRGCGGGSKQKFRWVDGFRMPRDMKQDVLEERVIAIKYDPCRKSQLALTGYGNKLRWQIASEGLEAGSIIRTTDKFTNEIFTPKVGDSYPIGNLPVGTNVCMIMPKEPGTLYLKYAGESGAILSHTKNRTIIKKGFYHWSVRKDTQCVVGKVSTHPLWKGIVGSPNRNRWRGITPNSGLWHRKDGRAGRKIRKVPPAIVVNPPKENDLSTEDDTRILLHHHREGKRGGHSGKKYAPKFWVRNGIGLTINEAYQNVKKQKRVLIENPMIYQQN